MSLHQPGVLDAVPPAGRYLFFSLVDAASASELPEALRRLATLADGHTAVVGVGPALVAALGAQVPGLREFPALQASVEVPATPGALWCWLRGTDRGDLVHLTRHIERALAPVLHLDRAIDGFRHGQGPNGHGRDLTGYEDGTENPSGDDALAAAFVQDHGAGLDGASLVAVQQWQHDFETFEAMPTREQDNTIGRRRADNEEIEDAPKSAHVKRTAQEDFEPEAFVLRRSMPWAMGNKAGLMFVAFGRSLDAFEAQMRRMAGLDDGIVDAVFRISKPVTGATYWCPPVHNGRLDWRALGL
jgi:porphyrinogen peroxidase